MSGDKDQEIFYLRGKVERLTKISADKSREIAKLNNHIAELEERLLLIDKGMQKCVIMSQKFPQGF